MNKDLQTDYDWKSIEEVKAVQEYFKVDEQMFVKGYHFAQLIIDGENATQSYLQAFGVETNVARGRAGGFRARKWVKELIRTLKVEDELLYIGDIKTIIRTGMAIIKDKDTSNRDFTEAIKALQPYIKQQVVKQETEITINRETNVLDTVMGKMDIQIKALADNGQMVDAKGDIIDVTILN